MTYTRKYKRRKFRISRKTIKHKYRKRKTKKRYRRKRKYTRIKKGGGGVFGKTKSQKNLSVPKNLSESEGSDDLELDAILKKWEQAKTQGLETQKSRRSPPMPILSQQKHPWTGWRQPRGAVMEKHKRGPDGWTPSPEHKQYKRDREKRRRERIRNAREVLRNTRKREKRITRRPLSNKSAFIKRNVSTISGKTRGELHRKLAKAEEAAKVAQRWLRALPDDSPARREWKKKLQKKHTKSFIHELEKDGFTIAADASFG